MSFTQPICDSCWAQRNPDRTPVKVVNSEILRCCFCGNLTNAGIFIRIDPRTVAYPNGRKRDPKAP